MNWTMEVLLRQFIRRIKSFPERRILILIFELDFLWNTVWIESGTCDPFLYTKRGDTNYSIPL